METSVINYKCICRHAERSEVKSVARMDKECAINHANQLPLTVCDRLMVAVYLLVGGCKFPSFNSDLMVKINEPVCSACLILLD